MSVHAKLEAANRRFSPRKRLRLGSVSTSLNEDVVIHDISSTGLLLETGGKLEAFDSLDVDLPEVAGPRTREAIETVGGGLVVSAGVTVSVCGDDGEPRALADSEREALLSAFLHLSGRVDFGDPQRVIRGPVDPGNPPANPPVRWQSRVST